MRRIPAEWQKFRQKFNPQTAEPVPLGKGDYGRSVGDK